MPKKKEESPKGVFNNYLKEFTSFLFSLLEESTSDLIRRFGDIIHFRQKLRKYLIFMMMVVASFVILLLGIADFIGSFFPGIRPGVMYIQIGIIIMLIAFVYKKAY